MKSAKATLTALLMTLIATPGLSASATVSATTAERIAQLEQRKTRLQDSNDIKRLQRAYGYYLDKGLWDDAAQLFATDGSIEVGLDGVYLGQPRVRQYLRSLGAGRNGLAAGQLNEHLQLMPVITLSADGLTARGTWRDLILAGQLGKDAYWGEGPFENTYIKQNGVWKIQKLHWFQTLYVPYVGGWAQHGDVNGGHFAGPGLTPDAPTTVAYKTWPSAYTPPFHFRGAAPVVAAAATPLTDTSTVALARRSAQLAADVQQLADQNDIEDLQRIYGFYIDKSQWAQAVSLFTDDAQFEIAGVGLFRGKASIAAYFAALGPDGKLDGKLYDNMQLQPIVHVSADGQSAQGRWHLFAQRAIAGVEHEWGTGIYENDYVRQGGVWKIRHLRLYPTMITPYGDGWGKTSRARSAFEPALAPDAPSRITRSTYDTVFVPPFHYPHPVKQPRMRVAKAAAPVQADALLEQLDRIERQLAHNEDVAAIENLQMRYGYYLATLLWDDLAALFDDNGTIEIAQRGVYVGKLAVRRNLNLYGQAGLDDGVLHNHMQYQPVITVADDGQSAQLRSRAFSMMGTALKSAQWMGGIYENEFIKVDGVWKFRKDQQINTYFAPYDVGWKDLKQRPAPGITESNPPDRPPSISFDMYPKNFLPPYHYRNPVTGR